jgi:hypothetical protein
MTRRQVALCAVLALYLLGFGFLGGMAFERLRFDVRRAAVLRQYDESVRQWQTHLMAIEKDRVERTIIARHAEAAD